MYYFSIPSDFKQFFYSLASYNFFSFRFSSGGEGCLHPNPQPAGQFGEEEESAGAGERRAPSPAAGPGGRQTSPAAGAGQGQIKKFPLAQIKNCWFFFSVSPFIFMQAI